LLVPASEFNNTAPGVICSRNSVIFATFSSEVLELVKEIL